MKSAFIFLTLCFSLILYSCHKDGAVDVSLYENLLNADYNNALTNHEALVSNVSVSDHNAHHPGSSTTVLSGKSDFMNLYEESDSLFSEHFFALCKELVKTDGMMGASGMGGMMGDGGMMGGDGMMEHPFDAGNMMSSIDSIHALGTSHMEMDSLMFEQMVKCNMMTSDMGNIKTLYGNMQLLRKEHSLLY